MMNSNTKLVTDYTHAIEKKLALGNATEHTRRSALETLVHSQHRIDDIVL
jgi:hypothetical protein